MREEPQRIAERLEATLRVPDGIPRAIAVVAHPLPTHGGTMRNPLVAAIARALARGGILALRFNFRGTGASAGDWTDGADEPEDVGLAVAHARSLAPGLPLGVCGYSFGALMTLRWLERGGRAEDVALVGLPLHSVSLAPQPLPPVPEGTFVVAGEHDEFATAAELRAALPRAVVAEVAGSGHFFEGKRDAVGALVAARFAATFHVPSPAEVAGE